MSLRSASEARIALLHAPRAGVVDAWHTVSLMMLLESALACTEGDKHASITTPIHSFVMLVCLIFYVCRLVFVLFVQTCYLTKEAPACYLTC